MNDPNVPAWQPVVDVTRLFEGINPVTIEGIELVVVKKEDNLSVFAGRCIHQEAPMAQGILEENHLVCSKHLWRYRLDTGELEGEPGIFLQKFEHQKQDQVLEIRRDAFDQLKELYNSYDDEDNQDYRP
ncbi:MAG: Rieske (2Fe-2S) protein [Deltaproteobacteria bacterium]|jgi:nitrite reductase/ring-hydroxylating ferredoxin subunit|nr:Rieske (2Fe-2S) protein [Deltaproteobacteria bacterium]MBT6498579.1 Rieske (2Fe-2S) protein [Deltaproteobacteria bacterium]MBT6615476.1 Rieske (2Fe-2S) protein [Deltaproteobacteria bacterium]MBT7155644.1 Rieske (2Fe-2S) protein [Deltaproteobacteria bacterium]MBT7715117.1 Rieske (2Fe-2S) protein [Deltaproteobacteria bacterium]